MILLCLVIFWKLDQARSVFRILPIYDSVQAFLCPPFPLIRMKIKKGAPRNAIMIPTGSSYGAKTTLASVSHSETKPAPNKAHRGNRCFDSDVAILLTACGTKSPTKESRPQTLTAAPANSAESSKNITRITFVFIPSPLAFSSPRVSTSSSFENVKS